MVAHVWRISSLGRELQQWWLGDRHACAASQVVWESLYLAF